MSIIHLFRDSLKAYFGDRSIIYAAGVSYYAVFGIAPLLVFVVTLAGVFIGRSNAFDKIVSQAYYLVGPQLAELLIELGETVSHRTFTAGGTLFSVLGLLFSAAGIFTQLDEALNDIWGIKTIPPQSLTDRLILFRHKTAPFVIVLFLGLLLSSSVLVDTFLVTITDRLAHILPQVAGIHPHINRLIIPILSFTIFTVIFKWLPDARSRWRDVAVGGLPAARILQIERVGHLILDGRRLRDVDRQIVLAQAAGQVVEQADAIVHRHEELERHVVVDEPSRHPLVLCSHHQHHRTSNFIRFNTGPIPHCLKTRYPNWYPTFNG